MNESSATRFGLMKNCFQTRSAYWYFRLNGFLQIENFRRSSGREGRSYAVATECRYVAGREVSRVMLYRPEASRLVHQAISPTSSRRRG